ncbi:ribonuclease H-like domain-containing protein [Mycena vitilis]|nr:ribonuclease H-like domain-containing protein [Mycena vitilis]
MSFISKGVSAVGSVRARLQRGRINHAPSTSKVSETWRWSIPGEENNTMEYPNTHRIHYLTSCQAVNNALKHITDGAIGFDTEYMPRKPSAMEDVIDDIFMDVPGNKRSAIIAWQATQTFKSPTFKILWDNIGLCVVQIARGNDVWILNMNRIREFPTQLERILSSYEITKVGVGMTSDLLVIWNDLGCNMNNLCDCGLMAKLLLAEKYMDGPFSNLSLEQSVEDILGYTIPKDLQTSNWKGDERGDISAEQKKYAAMDAHASLRLQRESEQGNSGMGDEGNDAIGTGSDQTSADFPHP